jgi:hypothetical protein
MYGNKKQRIRKVKRVGCKRRINKEEENFKKWKGE